MKRIFPIAALLLAAACRREEEIQVYRLAKPGGAEPTALEGGRLPPGHPPLASGAPAGDAVSGEQPPALRWTAPAGWKELPASGMRAASFSVPGGAELSIIVLPGPAGGPLANVNRWRGQIGLNPLDEQALAASSSAVSSPAGNLLSVDFAGAGESSGRRLLAAILDYRGSSWFFKLAGPSAAVEASRPAYRAFLGSLRPRP